MQSSLSGLGVRAVTLNRHGDSFAFSTNTGGAIAIGSAATGRTRRLAINAPSPKWLLVGAAFVVWCSAAACVNARSVAPGRAFLGAAVGVPVVAMAVLVHTAVVMHNLPTSGMTLLTALHATTTTRITLLAAWGALLLGLPLVAKRVLKAGPRGLFLGEWVWAVLALCVLVLTFSYDPSAQAASRLAVAAWVLLLLLSAAVLVVPWKRADWHRQSAPWQHWSGLGVCVSYALAIGLLTTFG